jgi:hypothetical protein
MTYGFLAPLMTGYGKRSTRAADRYADVCRLLCEARLHDSVQPETAGGSPAPARTARRTPTPAAKNDADGDSDSGDGDGPARRYALSASSHEGFVVEGPDGRRATLAVVSDDGEVLSGDVAAEAWRVAVAAYKAFLTGTGHLRQHASAPS